jgi:predicted nucleic acid-binding protein
MASYFLDSSAIVKRYVAEPGSLWVASLLIPTLLNRIYVAGIAGAEVVAAISRRAAAGGPARPLLLNAVGVFRADYARRFHVVDVSSALVSAAMDLAERYALRGYDSVQLAAATRINLECLAFGTYCTLVSADTELNAAARAEGLIVENPNDHP